MTNHSPQRAFELSICITVKLQRETMTMVTEGGQGAGIYDEQLECLCVHAYTARHSEPDTHCIRFEDYSCAKHMA